MNFAYDTAQKDSDKSYVKQILIQFLKVLERTQVGIIDV